jgi:mono/diheme cytochrome c family protein
MERILVICVAVLYLSLFDLALAQDRELATPVPGTPRPTPTVDRLAAPPTAENPTQADEGAQLYWLHCQPCHGDQGQGLTDEWRAQYPPEDQNCWNSGCHGNRPYENGFTLPTAVPAVIGEDSLARFATLGEVHAFIQAAMPYQDAGHLSEAEYLAITAFLARAHGVWNEQSLNTANVGEVRLQPLAPENVVLSAEPVVTAPAIAAAPRPPVSQRQAWSWLGIIVVLLLLGGAWLWHRYVQ